MNGAYTFGLELFPLWAKLVGPVADSVAPHLGAGVEGDRAAVLVKLCLAQNIRLVHHDRRNTLRHRLRIPGVLQQHAV